MKEDMCGNRSKTVRGQKRKGERRPWSEDENKDRRKAVARIEARI